MDAETQRLINNLIRFAVVSETDYTAKRVKVKDDSDDDENNGWQSDWLRIGTPSAGKNKIWQPPSIGEQVVVLSPGGDLAQGVVIARLFSDANPANGDSNTTTNWDIDGVLNVNADEINFVSSSKVNISAPENVNVTGDVKADGVSLKHHKNTGVTPGSSTTGEPEQ